MKPIVYILSRLTSFYKVSVLFYAFFVVSIISAQDNYEHELSTPINTVLTINLPIDTLNFNSSKTSFIIYSEPQHGSLTLNKFKAAYTPNNNYIGSDFFSYSIYRDSVKTTLVHVAITVNDSNSPLPTKTHHSNHLRHAEKSKDTLFQSQVENIVTNQNLRATNRFNSTNLSLFKNKKSIDEITVLYFLGTDCPISQKYITELKRLHITYEGRVRFYGIIPNNYTSKQVRQFKKSYAIPFNLLKDKNNSYAKELSASITPEVYLVKNKGTNGTIYYYGAIDNWFYALGKNRNVTTEHYLEEAITAVLSNEKVKIEHTNAIGCYIEY